MVASLVIMLILLVILVVTIFVLLLGRLDLARKLRLLHVVGPALRALHDLVRVLVPMMRVGVGLCGTTESGASVCVLSSAKSRCA